MRLAIGQIEITDAFTRWMRPTKPELNLKASSTEFVGLKYARNRSCAWGLNFSFTVNIGRVFPNYAQAEKFCFEHLHSLANGLCGMLRCDSALGASFGFKNSALKSVAVASEIGISTEFEYEFICGEPIDEFDCLVKSTGVFVMVGGKLIFIKM